MSLPGIVMLSFLVASALLVSPVQATSEPSRARESAWLPDELLVTCSAASSDTECREQLSRGGYRVERRLTAERAPGAALDHVYRVRIPGNRDLEQALDEMHARARVKAAQPNYVYLPSQLPDDEYFPLQWGQRNTGDDSAHTLWGLQGPDPRVPGADIRADEARAAYAGMSLKAVVVAIIDTGMDWGHPDLAARLWVNPDEIPGNGQDDDGNGYVDDVRGWDFVDGDNDPSDLEGRGTHVSGVIGAVGFNGIGIVGVAPNVSLMPLRFLSAQGGTTADAVEGIHYAVAKGALVINASWSGPPGGMDDVLKAAIQSAGDAGVLVVAPAGNDATDSDLSPSYPAAFELDNIISVAASTPWRDLASFSNWGRGSVDLAAPGDEIISTTPRSGAVGVPERAYQIGYPTSYPARAPWSGTSMATPAVAGAAALVFGLGPELWQSTWSGMSPRERLAAVRGRILACAERWPALSGTSVTEGHLNLFNLIEQDPTPPAPVGASLTAAGVGAHHVTLEWLATGDDHWDGRANYYELRYQETSLFDWATATPAEGLWTPGDSGTLDYFTVRGLDPDTPYTFGVEVVDNVGNRSGYTTVRVTTQKQGVPLPQETRFADTFDADDCSHWLLSGAWGCGGNTLSDSPNGDYPLNYRASAASAAPVSLDGTESVELSFDLTAFDYEEGFDFLFVEYSLDGINWRVVDRLTGSASGTQVYDVSFLAGMPAAYFRFLSLTDYGVARSGAQIDNVEIRIRPISPEPIGVPALAIATRLMLGLLLVTFAVAMTSIPSLR